MILDTKTNPYVYWTAALFFIGAAGYLVYKIRKEALPILYPISVYLSSIATFFILLGAYQSSKMPVIILFASFSVMFGASYIARFPLKLINAEKEKLIFVILLGISILIALYTYSTGTVNLQLMVANIYAFVVAGLFSMGYIIYSGLKTKNRIVKLKSIGVGTSLGLCCVVAHGLAIFQFLPVIAMPFFGIFTLNAPVLFAMSAPLTFILVLFLGRFIHGEKHI